MEPPHLLPDWGGYRGLLSDHGLDFSVTYIGEVLGNVTGGMERGVIYEGLLQVEVDLDVEALGLWRGGAFHGCMYYPHGDSLTEHYVGDLFTFSNIDAPDAVRLHELYYEHDLVPDRLSLRAGQLAADTEFASTDYGAVFISSTCGWPAIIGLNAPAPVYPLATPGVRLAADLGEHWSVQTGVYNGQPDPTGDDGEPLNPHGINFRIQDAFIKLEALYQWAAPLSATGLPGRAKIGGWYHTGTFDDRHYDALGLSLADPNSTGVPRTQAGNWGLYLSGEQQVTHEGGDKLSPQGLGLFARIGGSPSDRNVLDLYFEGGLTYTGLFPGRDADALGLAIVHGRMSREARELARDRNRYLGTSAPLPDHERSVEITYRTELYPGLAVQPVVAWVIHPGGSAALENALILGIRAVVDF